MLNSFQKQIGKTRIGCEIVNNKYPVMVMMMIDTDDKDERRSAVRGGIRKWSVNDARLCSPSTLLNSTTQRNALCVWHQVNSEVVRYLFLQSNSIYSEYSLHNHNTLYAILILCFCLFKLPHTASQFHFGEMWTTFWSTQSSTDASNLTFLAWSRCSKKNWRHFKCPKMWTGKKSGSAHNQPRWKYMKS